VLRGRLEKPQSQRNHPALVGDLQFSQRVRPKLLVLGRVQKQRQLGGRQRAVDLAEERVGLHILLPGSGRPGLVLFARELAPRVCRTTIIIHH
jgi:hypothetical protein